MYKFQWERVTEYCSSHYVLVCDSSHDSITNSAKMFISDSNRSLNIVSMQLRQIQNTPSFAF